MSKIRKILSIILPFIKVYKPVIGGAIELIKDSEHRIDNSKSETSKAAIPVSATAGTLSAVLLGVFSSLPAEEAGFASGFITVCIYAILIACKID